MIVKKSQKSKIAKKGSFLVRFFANNFFISKDTVSCSVSNYSFLRGLSNHVLKVYVVDKNPVKWGMNSKMVS